ncbi:MAG: hypothetical protein K2H64_09740 [Desulfovibrio sp.]|nr:hypothetical protein [Desulfovibrio sp.]
MSAMRARFSLPSMNLLRPVDIMIALPAPFAMAKKPYRAVWLLHCALEDAGVFFESLNAGDLAEEYNLALIAPSLGNDFFLDHPRNRIGSFLDEMKSSLTDILPLSPEKRDNAVLGISMGGFGALRWALASDAFKAAAAISGIFDAHAAPDKRVGRDRNLLGLQHAFNKTFRFNLLDEKGETRADADFNLLLKEDKPDKPPLNLYCGEEDFFSLPHTKAIFALATARGYPATLRLSQGSHDKKYWRRAFGEAIAELFPEDGK